MPYSTRTSQAPDPWGKPDVDDLIIRVLAGHASEFEVERLNGWRAQSAENDTHFLEIAQIWELTAPDTPADLAPPPPAQEILEAAGPGAVTPPIAKGPMGDASGGERSEAPTPEDESRGSKPGIRPPWKIWGLMAASVAALALGIQVFGERPLAEFHAPDGETRTVTLEDGTFVRLGEGSHLRVWGDPGTRAVSLEGRAFFAVIRDERRPFVVRTGPGEIRVLGTRFEVAEEPDGIRAVVVEGQVALSNRAGSVEVPAGGVARMKRGQTPTSELVEDPWSLMNWPDGILVFQNTPLAEAAEEVSRHFQRPLVVSDSAVGTRRVTAWFQGEAFEEIADALCAVTGATCTPAPQGALISAGASEGGTR
jgi:transmembrane sensor